MDDFLDSYTPKYKPESNRAIRISVNSLSSLYFQHRAMSSNYILLLLLLLTLLFALTSSFQSDELLTDDEEFGLEGSPLNRPSRDPPPVRSSRKKLSDSDSDSKIQFTLEHSFGDSDFTPAGTFSARIKTTNNGAQSLTKLRFSRNSLTGVEKEEFEKLLREDEFYRIRLPSNVLSPPGKDYVVSSVKARCLPRDGLDEHFVIHVDGVNILAVNYGAPGACFYPRQLRLPSKWSFNSHTILKSTEQAPRTPLFTEAAVGENGEGEVVQPPERSFWAKYWMYVIPLGLIVMNAITQAMNMPEEQAGGEAAAAAARRR